MSKVSTDDIKQIALLSRLELGEGEVDRFAEQLQNILAYVEHLSEVDVEGVEPFINAAGGGSVLRNDVIRDSLPNDEALFNAPRKGEGFFKVPAVVK